MASEVFNIAIDLRQLQEAVRQSEKIKNNLTGKENKSDKNGFFESIKKSNKELKNQNTLLKTSYKTIQLMRIALKGMVGLGIGAILGGGALAFSGFSNATKNNRKYKTIGISEREGYSLDYASEMSGFDKDSLANAAKQLQEALRDINKAKDFQIIGLDRDELKKDNPIDALMKVFEATGKNDMLGEDAEFLLKESFNNVAGDFEEFRTVLGDNVKEIEKYFYEGMRIYKDNYSNLKRGDQALIRLRNEFNRIRLMLATKFEPLITAVLKKISPLLEKGADAVGGVVDKAVNWFFEINKETGKTNLNQLFINLKNIAENIKSFWEKIKPVLAPFGQALVDFVKGLLSNPLFQWFIRTEEQKKAEKDIRKKLGIAGFSGGIKGDSKTLESLKLAHDLYKDDSIDYSQFKNVLKDIKSNIDVASQNGWDNYAQSKKYIEELEKIKPKWEVNDAVITKTGQVVKTSPQDYIFATKNPQALATAGAGNYTININANVRNDNDIQKIKYELSRLIKSINAGR